MEQADDVIKEVGIAFQTALAKKQGLFKQISQADENELNDIVW
jgi:excinuclease UvrABC nuclease subunit